jgi:hypothetical protein
LPKFGVKSLHILTHSPRTLAMRMCEDFAPNFVAKVWGEVFAHSHTFAIKHRGSIWNWLFELPGRIFCEQSPWCQRKLWALSWLCCLSVSLFLISVSLDFPCTAHAFFSERLSHHCQSLCCTFSEICTKCDAVPLSDPSQKWKKKKKKGQIHDSPKKKRP